MARMSVRLVYQSALEAGVTEFLGLDRYARGDRARAGLRNGYSDTTIKTTPGAVPLKRPKVQGTLKKFSSRLLAKHVTRTNALESRSASSPAAQQNLAALVDEVAYA